MKRIALLVFASLFLAACGDEAPDNAVVIGPGDASLTVSGAPTSRQVSTSLLIFKVRDGLKEDAHHLADVQIEFFASGPAFFSDLAGKALSTPTYIKTQTDAAGLAEVVASISAPGCTGATGEADIVNKGSVLATVGSAEAIWSGTLTIKCGAGAGATP